MPEEGGREGRRGEKSDPPTHAHTVCVSNPPSLPPSLLPSLPTNQSPYARLREFLDALSVQKHVTREGVVVAEEEAGAGGFPAASVPHLRGGREGRRGERVSW